MAPGAQVGLLEEILCVVERAHHAIAMELHLPPMGPGQMLECPVGLIGDALVRRAFHGI
jgi:hypothetical protein